MCARYCYYTIELLYRSVGAFYQFRFDERKTGFLMVKLYECTFTVYVLLLLCIQTKRTPKVRKTLYEYSMNTRVNYALHTAYIRVLLFSICTAAQLAPSKINILKFCQRSALKNFFVSAFVSTWRL